MGPSFGVPPLGGAPYGPPEAELQANKMKKSGGEPGSFSAPIGARQVSAIGQYRSIQVNTGQYRLKKTKMMKTKCKRGRCKRLDDPMAFGEIPWRLYEFVRTADDFWEGRAPRAPRVPDIIRRASRRSALPKFVAHPWSLASPFAY